MNFIEAAEQILRAAGKPLHYKKITEIALGQNLLSHVGKTPEITMSSRLAMIVKKDRGDAPIVKVKPGVFGLREFPDPVMRAAMAESGSEYEFEAKEVVAPLRGRKPSSREQGDAEQEDTEVSTDGTPTGEEEKNDAKKLPGGDVFPAEADDDEPILANLDDEGGSEGGDENGRGGRRRRRGRRRKGEGGGREGGRPEREARPSGGGQSMRPERSERPDRDRGRNHDRNDRGPRPDFRQQQQQPSVRRTAPRLDIAGDWNRESDEGEGVGPTLADAVFDALDRLGEAATFVRIAELLTRKGRLAGDPAALAPTVAAATRSDSARREAAGLRPRFFAVAGHIMLTDWALPKDAVFAERDAQRLAERQRKNTRRTFIREIEKLPPVGLIELIASWLNTEGVSALRAVRRPGGTPAEFALAGKHQRGPEDRPLAIVFSRDGSDITAERVIEVRGALHHFDNASAAWVVTTGWVTPEARAEAQASGATPVTLFDGAALARAMERARIGIVTYSIPTLAIDFSLLESLGADALTSRDRMRRHDGGEGGSRDEANGGAQAAEGGAEGEAPAGDERPGRRRRRRGRGGRPGEEVSFDSLAPQGESDAPGAEASDLGEDSDDSGAEDREVSASAADDEADIFDRDDANDEDSSTNDPAAEDFDADEDESTAEPEDADGSEEADYLDREND
jgi:hypothetical protein